MKEFLGLLTKKQLIIILIGGIGLVSYLGSYYIKSQLEGKLETLSDTIVKQVVKHVDNRMDVQDQKIEVMSEALKGTMTSEEQKKYYDKTMQVLNNIRKDLAANLEKKNDYQNLYGLTMLLNRKTACCPIEKR